MQGETAQRLCPPATSQKELGHPKPREQAPKTYGSELMEGLNDLLAATVLPAVVRLDSQGLPSAGNVLLQRRAAHHPTTTSILEV